MRGVTKEYTNGEVTVVWKNRLCIHSGNCVNGLPGVFDWEASPWVNITGASTEEIISQVKKCPSGALNFYLNKEYNDLQNDHDHNGLVNEVLNNEDRKRFETEINGDYAYINYRRRGNDLVLLHTFVPPAERNKGVAAALIKHVLDDLKEHNQKIIVYCPTIEKYINLHPEYKELLDEQYYI